MVDSRYLTDDRPTEALLDAIVRLCQQAGLRVMDVFQRAQVQVDYKEDSSPVTEADLAAHNVLVSRLEALLPDIPIVSEESEAPGYEERRRWTLYWLVDPLDGTKEFINGNGEFTVNVALVRKGQPVLGVVHAPVFETTYAGLTTLGAFKYEGARRHQIHTRAISAVEEAGLPLEVVASRRHGTAATEQVIANLQKRFPSIRRRSVGSSLKFCLIAEGKADFYPRLGPTCEWDTAAAQAVVEAAGGAVLDETFGRLLYNQKSSLLNPGFYVVGDATFPWAEQGGPTHKVRM